MLVLTRKTGESIVIGDLMVEVEILQVQGGRVKLGIKGDKEVVVHRREVYDAIQNQKEKLVENLEGKETEK